MEELTKEEKEAQNVENERSDEFEFPIDKLESVKKDFQNIDRQTVILGLMVLGVCVVFFFLGYYFGTHNATVECNKIIAENQLIGLVSPLAIFGGT